MEKRTSKRIPVSLDAHLTRGGTTQKAFIVSISKNGLNLVTASGADAADKDEQITVKFNISPDRALELKCRAARSGRDKSAGQSLSVIALQIIDPPEEFIKFYKSSFYKVKNYIAHDAIAIVGMACYYPGAPDLRSFWENVLSRRRAFRRLPEQRLPLSEYYDPDPFAPDKTYGDRAAVIDGFEFDWVKRGIPKTVVESSDIVHWLALEVALRALEDAGYGKDNIPRDRSGVILGNTLTGEHSRSQQMRLRWPYVKKVFKTAASQKDLAPAVIEELLASMEVHYKSAFAPVTEDTLAGNLSNTIAGRICNFLDLHGGGYTVDGACSSSLIAVATAANALSAGTLDLAVVGGIDVSLDTFELVGFAKTNALTKEDMKVYDRRASGFIPGEGAGFAVLKRLQDARADGDYIYAVLRGWGISSDGKGGMTAPKAQTQALAIQRAYGKAGYGLGTVDFIEGHGTGTVAGDKAELGGIANAMDGETAGPLRRCGITSLKSLIGHTKAASGIGGFIKAVLAVNRRVIPPTAGCSEPSQVFEDKARGVYPVLQGEVRGEDAPMRAGVSGMGFGGINCHVTVESAGEPAGHIAPSIGERELLASHQDTELFVLSAGSQQEMAGRLKRLEDTAAGMSTGEMADLSMELAGDASPGGAFRLAMVAGFPKGLTDCIGRAEKILKDKAVPAGGVVHDPRLDVWAGNSVTRPRVGFLFPGQGSQQLNMGRRLVERFAWARDLKERADSWLSGAGYGEVGEFFNLPLDRALGSGRIDAWKEALSRSEAAQPAICLASLLWMRYLDRLGIRPAAAGGHSLGELTAFHAAGALDEKELILFSAFRGRATSAPDGNPGTMASFACGREKAGEILKEVEGYAVVANVNGPAQTVISGERQAVEKAAQLASFWDIKTKYLPVSNAFHSRYMAGAAEHISNHAPIPETIAEPDMKLFSSMDGGEVSAGTGLRTHFGKQVTHPVDFISLVNRMKDECDILVEAGPGRVLSDLVKSIAGAGGPPCLPVEPRAGDDRSLNALLGCCFVHGADINWHALFENRLTRPFVPASRRAFIDNPCERTAALVEEEKTSSLPAGGPAFPAPNPAEGSAGLFSKQQVDFIRGLIQAEMSGSAAVPEPRDAHDGSPAVKAAVAGTGAEAAGPDELIKLASEMTGFPAESISLDHRLLDDLNLDSIKAGHFAVKAVKLYGAEGKLDPTAMANSSLREIFGRIEPHISQKTAARGPSDEIGEQPPEAPAVSYGEDNWVRDFRVVYEEQARSAPAFGQIMAAASKEKRRVLLVSDSVEDGLCREMQGILVQNGVAASLMDYEWLGRTPGGCGGYDYALFLLPRKKASGPLTGRQLRGMAARMHVIGKAVASTKTQAVRPTYVAVQFGDGGFHKPGAAVSLEAKGGAAFFCGIHLEDPSERLRVIEFNEKAGAAGILEKLAEELQAADGFAVAAFDENFKRYVPVMEPVTPGEYRGRNIGWTGGDVVLVTGGAKGITAECALGFAKEKGVKLALVGSTVLIEKDGDVQKTLQRYRESGISYRYYACDIADRQSVLDLKKRVEQDLGPITGVIHGAALNRPRPAGQASLEEAAGEIAPKLLGAINILESLEDSPPKLLAGFGSVIGVTGMKGNTWYGFANEALNLILQEFRKRAPDTHVITFAFSIWGGVGMGARMGSLDFLSRLGILPMPKEKAVGHFLRLMDNDPGEAQVVVAGRMGSIGVLRRAPDLERAARYLEEILFFEKGVEIEAKAVLTLDRDPYLKDHVFKGTCLLPTVFGVEAMAQAVSAVTGITGFDFLRLEKVLLSLPITVEQGSGTEIRIRALVEDTDDGGGPVRVKAGITVGQTDFSRDHFEAVFVLGAWKGPERCAVKLPETPLDIRPEEDLYGHMLFQGSLFQRITSIRSLDAKRCIFDSRIDNSGRELVTKDPYFRDTLLQSVQIILPDVTALPVEVEEWEISPGRPEDGTCTVVADLVERDGDVINADVAAVDPEGRVVERLRGYKTKVVGKVQDAPGLNDLKDPDGRDEEYLNARLRHYCGQAGMASPAVSVRHQSGFHELSKAQRHKVEKELFERAYRRLKDADGGLPEDVSVAWTKAGKPFAKGADGAGLSCSHDDRVCLCLAGRGEHGCDIEALDGRSAGEWRDLLGAERAALFETVAGMDDSADRAGARIWCALESLRKAAGAKDIELRLGGQSEDCIVFEGAGLTALTFPVRLLRGRERIAAVAAKQEARAEGQAADRGPLGQRVFTDRFPLGLRDSSTFGGGVYFANYFHWLGKVREKALKPIGRYIADEFPKGRFMVTNFTETEISGYARNHETMDARAWVDGISGSSLMLHFQWRKLLPDGTAMPVAFGRQLVSWIKVIGHGIVEPVPVPGFFMDFLKDNGFLPEEKGLPLNDETLFDAGARGLGKMLHECSVIGEASGVLEESVMDTTMEHSNLARNIYFSNYFTWQGRLRDRYLFGLSPELYRKMDRHGQFASVHSRIKHLREAMPFDRIAVTMKLSRLYERGVDLYFEYFKVEPDGERVKLAHGSHVLAWMRVDGSDNYVPQALPPFYVEKILEWDRIHGLHR